MSKLGTLYIVATPIGNLEDMTYRAVRILREVDVIAAEDTRHSIRLLHHYNISTPSISLHEFNEQNQLPLLLSYLKKGKNIALISDAGTPLISDPGYILVRAMRQAGMNVVPIPGACAAIAALCAAGLPTHQFVFEGFLSSKPAERRRHLECLKQESRTLIFYEAPHRILKLLRDIQIILGSERPLMIAKELTKTFETFMLGTAQEICAWLEADVSRQKGEFVVLVRGAEVKANAEVDEAALQILHILLKALPLKQAVVLAAQITGVKKNVLYSIAVEKPTLEDFVQK